MGSPIYATHRVSSAMDARTRCDGAEEIRKRSRGETLCYRTWRMAQFMYYDLNFFYVLYKMDREDSSHSPFLFERMLCRH